MSLFMYPVQQAAETPLVPAQICTKTCLKCTLRWKAVIKSLHCIYSIFIFGLVSKNEYIQYSYLFRYLGTNIFDIRIRSGCKMRIYSIFVFGQLSRYEYIRYSYSVNFFFTNIFVFVFGQEFDIRVTLSIFHFLQVDFGEDQLGKGSKIKLIIFAEFSAKGVQPPTPLRGK